MSGQGTTPGFQLQLTLLWDRPDLASNFILWKFSDLKVSEKQILASYSKKTTKKKKTEVVFLIPLSTPFSFRERFGSIPRILSSTHLGTGRHHQAFLVAKTN